MKRKELSKGQHYYEGNLSYYNYRGNNKPYLKSGVLKDLKKEFSYAFQNADTVLLCPVYTAGEKIKLGFSYLNFAKEIIKNSKVKLFLINDFKQLAIFLKKNMYGKKIVIGMGAGSISNWMRNLKEII